MHLLLNALCVYGPLALVWYSWETAPLTVLIPPCATSNTTLLGDGVCHPAYNVAECDWDGGDCCLWSCEGSCLDLAPGLCLDPLACNVTDLSRFGDGRCDASLNTEKCTWDGGDCCFETCRPRVFDCEFKAPYICDPRSQVSSEPPRPAVVEEKAILLMIYGFCAFSVLVVFFVIGVGLAGPGESCCLVRLYENARLCTNVKVKHQLAAILSFCDFVSDVLFLLTCLDDPTLPNGYFVASALSLVLSGLIGLCVVGWVYSEGGIRSSGYIIPLLLLTVTDLELLKIFPWEETDHNKQEKIQAFGFPKKRFLIFIWFHRLFEDVVQFLVQIFLRVDGDTLEFSGTETVVQVKNTISILSLLFTIASLLYGAVCYALDWNVYHALKEVRRGM